MDRIDIWLEVDRVSTEDLSGEGAGEKSAYFRNAVADARRVQRERFEKVGKTHTRNAEMSARDLVEHIDLDIDARKTLNLAAERLGFSPRVYHRMIKVARTIADLASSENIERDHILEAVEYRPKKFDI
jgi:magnesium chelatase family protein